MKLVFNESIFLETIKKVDGKWVVYPKSGEKRLGTHNTKEGAKKQLQAIEISKIKEMKIFINEYNYFSDVYEYSTNFVNMYIAKYGVRLRKTYNTVDLSYEGIHYNEKERYIHTIISPHPRSFNIPLIGKIYKTFDIIFTPKLKSLGGQSNNSIFIKADIDSLINISAYEETLRQIKNTFIHEVAHLLDRIIHHNSKALVSKERGGLYSKPPSKEENSTDPEVAKRWLTYLNQEAEINAYLNQALNVQAKQLIDKFREILKSQDRLETVKYFMSINKYYNEKHLAPSLRWLLNHDYDISGKSFVENVVYKLNAYRAKTTGVMFDPKHHNLFNLTEEQEKYIYRKAYPTFNKIYDKYAKELIEKLKTIKIEDEYENRN